MINIIYRRKYHRVNVVGHANSAEKGHDLVCAAASTLVYTLAGNVERLEDCIRDANINLKDGDAEVSCVPKCRMESVITLVFDAVFVGFEMLAKTHPDFVKCEIRE